MTPRSLFFLALVLALVVPVSAKDDWLPISPADLTLKDNPAQPGASAMILYREVYTDNGQADQAGFENTYLRIKIFTEKGKEHADIRIPYIQGLNHVADIKARVIRADGTIIPFTGKIFDKVVVKSRWVKFQAKAFTLPDVQVGSIIEYKYTSRLDSESMLLPPTWDVQEDLFTRHAKFVLKPYTGRSLRWILFKLPPGTSTKQNKDNTISLEMDNIPGLETENYMPPERVLKARVDFFYYSGDEKLNDPAQFWKQEGKDWYKAIEDFIGKRGGIQQAAAQLAPPSDSADVRLKKLYDRVQQVRNLSYERQKTEKEQSRENLKDNNNVEDVLKRNYGYHNQINRLFVALARAAGFKANIVRVSERDTKFFQLKLLDDNQLDSEVSVVTLTDGKESYFDPGTPFCPFGLLSWERTGVDGILPGKDGGVFVTTPRPLSEQSVTERQAEFRLDTDGSLDGKLELAFRGQEALQRRLEARDWDDTQRRKDLEDDIKRWLPTGATINIESMSGWTATDEPLRATVKLKVPGYALSTGRRLMLPRELFRIANPFRLAQRVHPVYFEFPFSTVEEVTLVLPAGFTVESLPAPQNQTLAFGKSVFSAEQQGNSIKLRRSMAIEGLFFRVEYYPALKAFYDRQAAAEDEQLILRAGDVRSN